MRLVYKDIAVGAEEDAVFTSAQVAEVANLGTLAQDISSPIIATLEPSAWFLDGTAQILTEDNMATLAFVSANISRADCTFDETPEIDIAFDAQYSSLGLTLRFSERLGDMCSEIEVIWYRAEKEIARGAYFPDALTYFCKNRVEAYDAVKIRLVKTWLPYSRARLEFVGFGITRAFDEKSLGLSSVSALQQIDPTNSTIPANAFDWELLSDDGVEYLFQFKQPIEVYADGLIGVYYIESATRRTATQYKINCADAIGLLETDTFAGGIYTNYDAITLIREICGDIPVYIESGFEGQTVSGYIPAGTKRREALRMVCFALMAIADTSASDGIKLFHLSVNIAEPIEKARTYYGTSISTSAAVTAVKVTAYSYTEGSGDKTIDFNGKKYAYTTTEYVANNPLATASDKTNVKEFKDITLVSDDIAQSIADYLMSWYMYRETHNLSFKLVDEMVGDYVSTVTDYGAAHNGIITRLTLKMSRITKATADIVGAIDGGGGTE